MAWQSIWHGNPCSTPSKSPAFFLRDHVALGDWAVVSRTRDLWLLQGDLNEAARAADASFPASIPPAVSKSCSASVSTNGDVYLRRLFVQGARTVMQYCSKTGIRTALLVRSTYGSYPPECGDCSADEHVGPDDVGGFMQKRDAAYSCSGHGDLNLLAHR